MAVKDLMEDFETKEEVVFFTGTGEDRQTYRYSYVGNCEDCNGRLFLSNDADHRCDERVENYTCVPVGNHKFCPACYLNNILEVDTPVHGETALYVSEGKCVECGLPVYNCVTHPIRNDEAIGRRLVAFNVTGNNEPATPYCQICDPSAAHRAKSGDKVPADIWAPERYGLR